MICRIWPLALILLTTVSLADPPILRPCALVRVIDGDTIVCTVAGQSEHVRIVGVDTPELHAHCDTERARANAATTETTRLLFRAGQVELLGRPDSRDRYGRLLARVHADGQDIAGLLIAGQFGVPYAGGHRRNWCD